MSQSDTNFFILLQRGTLRGIRNLWREHQWGATLGSLIGIFLLIQLLLLIFIGTEGIQSLLKSRTDLRLEIRSNAEAQGASELFSAIQQLPYVEEAVYITKEQAYERTKKDDPELIEFLERFSLQNPFPDTIGVTLSSLDYYNAFSRFTKDTQWQHVLDPTFLSETTGQETHVYELLNITQAGRIFTLVILLLTTVILVFVIMELTGARSLARSNEVLIERLVGARTIGTLTPFITEAVLLSYISIVVSGVLAVAFLYALPYIIPSINNGGTLGDLRAEIHPMLISLLPMFLVIEIVLIPFIASFGTWLGMRKQMFQKEIIHLIR
jgi:cell division protein FtsX